jgi:DnaK suppressor protein
MMPNKRRNPKTVKSPSKRQETLRAILLKEKQEVTRNLEEQMGHQLNADLQQRIDHVLDSGDQATLDIAEELDLSLLEMRNKNLKAINDALQRLKEGTYGICEACGGEIPEKRLMVMPFTPCCVACQEKQEALEKVEKEEDRFK